MLWCSVGAHDDSERRVGVRPQVGLSLVDSVAVAVELFGVVALGLLGDLAQALDQLRCGLVGEVEGEGDEWRGLVAHEGAPVDARALALRRETGLGAFGGLLLGLTESIALGVELDDFRAMDEAVDEGDDAGGGGEHVGPFGEGFVGGDEDGVVEVSACDDLEEEVGIAVVVVEVSDLVDGEELGAGEATQSAGEGCVGVLGGELVEHVRGGGESGGEGR